MIPNNDLQQLVEMSRNTVVSTNMMVETLKAHDGIIKSLLKRADETVLQVDELGRKVTDLELNYEITDEQYGFILAKIKSRVRGFCDLTSVYYQTYIMDCHGFLKKNYNEGSKAKCTKKRNYDRVMQGIEAWVPDKKALEARKDKRDMEARKHEMKIDQMVKGEKK